MLHDRRVVDENHIGGVAVAIAHRSVQDWHHRPAETADAEKTVKGPFRHLRPRARGGHCDDVF